MHHVMQVRGERAFTPIILFCLKDAMHQALYKVDVKKKISALTEKWRTYRFYVLQGQKNQDPFCNTLLHWEVVSRADCYGVVSGSDYGAGGGGWKEFSLFIFAGARGQTKK